MVIENEIILKNEEFLSALLADIGLAKATIDLEYYIFEDDEVGRQVADALCAAAQRGVSIRLLVDGIGSLGWGNSLTQKMENCHIQTRVYHPIPFLSAQWSRATGKKKTFFLKLLSLFSKLNRRDHKKVTIIDNSIVYIGSANITKHLAGNEIWRETTVRLQNVDTHDLLYAFEKNWGRISFPRRLRMVLRSIDPDPLFRLNYSFRRRYVLHHEILRKISCCSQRIWITNPYFIPAIHLLKKLRYAQMHGVDVRIILPSKSDVPFESWVTTTFYAELLHAGIAIYEYLPCMLHVKALTLDDWSCVGSSNFNNRSLRHDLEVDVKITSDHAKSILEKQFLDDVSHAKQITIADLKKQSILVYWLGKLILTMRYWI